MTTTGENPLAATLSSGEPFGVPAGAVERIDTTAAHIFLVGERAFKLKRPVRFSFLDFTTAASRRRALANELRLNRRTAPELYLGLRKLVRRDAGIALVAEDDPAAADDWVLEMVRFPAAAELDRIAARGPLAAELARGLGEAVATLHAAVPPRPDCGGAEAMLAVVDGNLDDLKAVSREIVDPPVVAMVDAAARAALDRLGPLFDQRRAAGFVRHCHGDLHLGNVVALDGRVVPFDCIEFDDAFACIDVVYDLAFLLMDLVHRGDVTAARIVLQTYVERTDDLEGLALLPFCMGVRATIRAKIAALAGDAGSDPAAGVEARAYLDLARDLEPPPAPRLVGVGGLSGSGKTTLAQALAPHLRPLPGALVWRSDVERKRLFGVDTLERLPAAAYAPENDAAVYQALRRRTARTLEAGFSAVVDAVHRDPAARAELEAVAERSGAPFVGLWLDAAPNALVERVEGRTADASDADASVVQAQVAAGAGEVAWRRVAADAPPADVLDTALAALGLGSASQLERG